MSLVEFVASFSVRGAVIFVTCPTLQPPDAQAQPSQQRRTTLFDALQRRWGRRPGAQVLLGEATVLVDELCLGNERNHCLPPGWHRHSALLTATTSKPKVPPQCESEAEARLPA